jgi:polar amino acid transport system substrate-binding protein
MRGKKLVIVGIFSLLVILLTIGSISSLAAEKKVYINGIDADFPPFAYIDEKGNPVGFDIDCVNWIAEEMGFEVKHQPISWDTIIPNLTAKKIDFIASGLSITEERKKVIAFTIPYWEIDFVVVAREDSNLNIITALSGKYTLAVSRGCSAQEWVQGNLVKEGIFREDKFVNCESALMALNDVASGRSDSTIGDDVMLGLAIKGKPLKILGTIKTGETYGYGVRKDDQELKEILDEGIRRLMKSPKWEELKAKWIS